MAFFGRHLLVLICFEQLKNQFCAAECQNAPMDIVFLLDSSDNERSVNFNEERKFTINMINLLWSGKNEFGVITYADDPSMVFRLNSYSSSIDIETAIKYMWFSTGKANVSQALQYAVDNAFQEAHGDRPLAPNAIICLAHSTPIDETDISDLVLQLQQKQIDLFVVLMGSGKIITQFQKITTSNHIFITADFDSLHTVNTILSSAVCKGRAVLTNWSSWSVCGKTCGSGLRRRFRSCEKRQENDKGCDGEELMQEERCNTTPCTAPVNGEWTYWDKWSSCTKTCGKGKQTRLRFCSAPTPANGGLTCQGRASETKDCADWSCPDCTRTCPSGGRLSAKCDICECSSVKLYGHVSSVSKRPVGNADIFLKSRMYSAIATTNYIGSFEVNNTCIMGETVVVQNAGFSTATITPDEINSTHWFVNATLKELISPIFTKHPNNKARLVGQSVTLCCKAVGYPTPTSYTWFKGEDSLLLKGTLGNLTIQSVTVADTGTYSCSCETDAGISRSEKAQLIVKDGVFDSCGTPQSRIEILPEGCYVAGDTTKNDTFDKGTCGNEPCVSRDLHDNGTCSDWWPDYCCDASETEIVDINCGNFSYQTSRIKACKCQICHIKTIVSGKAYGLDKNGTKVPLRRGSIYVQGRRYAGTNVMGYFSFEVPQKLERITATFIDNVYKKLLDSTKVITVTTGCQSSLTIVLPLRPTPVHFDSDSGLDLDLGQSDSLPSAGRFVLPGNSLITQDGKPHTGSAKAHVHFMDPRNVFDLAASEGEFSCEDNGDIIPLETFGIFKAKFVDLNGKMLKVSKPIAFQIDPSIFNVTTTGDGEPNIDLWHFDHNKGIWVFDSKTMFSSSTSKRSLLDNVIVGSLSSPKDIPKIDLIAEVHESVKVFDHYENVFDHYETNSNWDKRYPVYRKEPEFRLEDRIKETHPKRGACFVSVRVFQSFSTKEPDTGGTYVTAVTKEFGGTKFKGFDKQPTTTKGHVCLKIFCDSEVYIYAENKLDSTRLHAFKKHDLPVGFNVTNIKNSTEIVLYSKNFEDAPSITDQIRYSPVYYYEDGYRCETEFEKNYNFHFGPLTKAPSLYTKVSENVFNDRYSWYPYPPRSPTRRSCFIKVLLKIKDEYDVRILAISYQNNVSGGQYGTHNIGPVTEPTFNDLSNRAACIEFRCPGLVNDSGNIIQDVPTFIEGRFNPVPKKTCRISAIKSDLNVQPLNGGREGFRFTAVAGDNYGPIYGVYIGTSDKEQMRTYCYNGNDSGRIGNDMKPTVNPAVVFECN